MAGRPRSLPLVVDSGPGDRGSEGVRGALKTCNNLHFYSHPDVRHELICGAGTSTKWIWAAARSTSWLHATKLYKFIGLGARDAIKPH